MKRRTMLRRTAALGALAVAGCVSGDGGSEGTTTEPPTTEPPTTEPRTTDPGPVTIADKGIVTAATGCRTDEGAETATVAFDRDASRVTVTGVLHTPDPCHRAVLQSVTFETETSTLRLDVAAEDTGEVCAQCIGTVEYEAAVTLSRGVPDRVEITHEGQSVRTERGEEGSGSDGSGSDGSGSDGGGSDGGGEGTPVLASTRLEVLGRSPTSGEGNASGDIEFRTASNEVVVTGTVLASDGCETAKIRSVAYDAATDTLSLDVEATTPESKQDQACTMALADVEYRVTVGFENAVPHAVEVSQEGYGGMGAGYGEASASAPTTSE